MRLEEKHKEFAVKGFSQFMKLSEVVAAFMDEFHDEIMDICDIKLETEDEFIDRYINEHKYFYATDIEWELEPEFAEADAPGAYIETVQKMEKKARKHLAARLRRFNINHQQFPNKYRDLFNKTRDEYIAKYKCNNLHHLDILSDELGALYGYAKTKAYQEGDVKYISLSHQILKTAVTAATLAAQNNTLQNADTEEMESIEDTSTKYNREYADLEDVDPRNVIVIPT